MTEPKRGIGFLFGCCLVHPFDWGVKHDPKKFGFMVHLGPVLMSIAWEAWDREAVEPDHYGDSDAPAEQRGAGEGGYTVIYFHPERGKA